MDTQNGIARVSYSALELGSVGKSLSVKRVYAGTDLNGDGKIDEAELVALMRKHAHTEGFNILLKQIILALLIVVILMIGSITAMTIVTVQKAKDTNVDDNGVLVDKNTGDAIKTASTDFKVNKSDTMTSTVLSTYDGDQIFTGVPIYDLTLNSSYDVTLNSSSQTRRLSDVSYYCGSFNCDEKVSNYLTLGYTYVFAQNNKNSRHQLDMVRSSGYRGAVINMWNGNVTTSRKYNVENFFMGTQIDDISFLDVTPESEVYFGEEYLVLTPYECTVGTLSDTSSCLSPVLRHPYTYTYVNYSSTSNQTRRHLISATGRKLLERNETHFLVQLDCDESHVLLSDADVVVPVAISGEVIGVQLKDRIRNHDGSYTVRISHMHASKPILAKMECVDHVEGELCYPHSKCVMSIKQEEHLHLQRYLTYMQPLRLAEFNIICRGKYPSDALYKSAINDEEKRCRYDNTHGIWFGYSIHGFPLFHTVFSTTLLPLNTPGYSYAISGECYTCKCEFNNPDHPNHRDCFSGDQLLTLVSGAEKPIRDVTVGDVVLTANSYGEKVFSPVIFLPHLANTQKTNFLRIATESGSEIKLTPSHHIVSSLCSDKCWKSIFGGVSLCPTVAASVLHTNFFEEQYCLLRSDGVVDPVTSVEEVEGEGAYTVVTMEEYIVVNGLVASPFAHSHSITHFYYHFLRVWYWLSPSTLAHHDVNIRAFCDIMSQSISPYVHLLDYLSTEIRGSAIKGTY